MDWRLLRYELGEGAEAFSTRRDRVRYDGAADNALKLLFDQWNDPEWLVDFFLANMADLESYFKITDINQAIYDTIDDNQRMQCLILDISPEADLDKLFRPLENSRTSEMLLGK